MDPIYRDRSDRGKLRLSGPQRLWFLHQIMTQAFEDMTPGEHRDTALITAHGRMQGYMETVATEEAVLVHFERELRSSLPEAIRRYVFATRVEIDDVTEEMALLLVAGEDWMDIARRAAPDAVLHPTRSLGVEAGYVWAPIDERSRVSEALKREATEVAEEELEALRVTNRSPRWGREMNVKSLPQEAGIDEWAVHFDKGCYVGQEAMAKIHFRGKVNRRLVRLEVGSARPGGDVIQGDVKVGSVTSAAEGMALAIVKHSIEQGSHVDIEGVKAKVLD